MKKLKRYLKATLSAGLTLLICFVFSVGAMAANGSNYYANEEAAEDEGCTTTAIDYFYTGITPSASKDGNLVVVLDPGHGAVGHNTSPISKVSESTYNYKVASYCKAYLEKYGNVTVYMTRGADQDYSLEERAQIASKYGADLLISCHFNAGGGSGCEVYVSRLEEYALTDFGQTIVNQLNALGISKRSPAVKTRQSETNTLWTDNTRIADYYGIIKHPAKREIPACIIEHCFYDNASEVSRFMSSDAKLQALGEADAKAIISYFKLDQSISDTTLTNQKYTAIQELDSIYNSLNKKNYNSYYRSKIEAVYTDAKDRINAANNLGKIDLTLNRATKTLKNYPSLRAGEGIYSDTSTGAWYYPAVLYCTENKLFYGTSDTTFSPQMAITRGMFITVIGRMANADNTLPAQTKFSDVDANQYYAPYVKWGSENNIIAGMSETSYAPNTMIRREDMLRILQNYCNTAGIELKDVSTKTAADFKDNASIDSWATEAMDWAIAKGIINGNDQNRLCPRENATRAEVAQIMMNFCKSIGK